MAMSVQIISFFGITGELRLVFYEHMTENDT